ncbi:hypothetical protein [Streptomyces sp. E2N166]|uniref:hypothetical protein n=1 Tax=Streptomyces sp. E2N166 TaxID=1851909 RepID=UPI000EF65C0D|nr:hypothetical protein [Streptomyces sp. E2N166]
MLISVLRGLAAASDAVGAADAAAIGSFDEGVGLDPGAADPGAYFAVPAEAALVRGAQDAFLAGLVLVAHRDAVALFVLAAFADGLASAAAHPQMHGGLDAQVAAHFRSRSLTGTPRRP